MNNHPENGGCRWLAIMIVVAAGLLIIGFSFRVTLWNS